ncbi:MAG: hypothetical protein ACT4PV_08120 [Planctomycetaceae bacterium]
MARYVLSAAAAALLFGIALRAQGTGRDALPALTFPSAIESGRPDRVEVAEATDGGRAVTIHHRLAGQLGNARLIYELEGKELVADAVSNCLRSLDTTRVREELHAATLRMEAHLPPGARRVRMLLEDETGVRLFRVLDN